ncbi:MAG: hypothetical protein ACM3JB_28405 [Acidobacteriaceae bacterium]
MKNFIVITVLFAATTALASTWNNVVLVDQACSTRASANPDAHTRGCALQCAKSGFGILTPDGKFLKFDQHGNDEAAKLLSSASKKDHLRVKVVGDRKGDTIAVNSVAFE